MRPRLSQTKARLIIVCTTKLCLGGVRSTLSAAIPRAARPAKTLAPVQARRPLSGLCRVLEHIDLVTIYSACGGEELRQGHVNNL